MEHADQSHVDDCLILAVRRMAMGRGMIRIVHADLDPVERADGRHLRQGAMSAANLWLMRLASRINSMPAS